MIIILQSLIYRMPFHLHLPPFTPQIRAWTVLERQHFNTMAQSEMSAFDQKYQLLQSTTKNPTQPMVCTCNVIYYLPFKVTFLYIS